MKPSIAMVFLNMNTTQVFLFGRINNLYKHVCVYAYDVFTEVLLLVFVQLNTVYALA